MDTLENLLVAAVIIAVVIGVISLITIAMRRSPLRWTTIQQWEHAVRFDRGQMRGRVEPGQYFYWSFLTSFVRADARRQYVTVPGQEVLTSDAISIRLSLAAAYEVVDIVQALTSVADYEDAFYLEAQIALREFVAALTIDELLAQRSQLGARVLERVRPKVQSFGVQVHSVDVKDMMFPGNLRDIFAKVIEAQKQGLAVLERARGESAALRNLANAAQTIRDNPALLQLRLLQALGESEGNTFVFGAPTDGLIVPVTPEQGKSAGKSKKSKA